MMMALLRTPRRQYTGLILLLLCYVHGTNGLQKANISTLKNVYEKGTVCSTRKTPRAFDDDARGAKQDTGSSFEKKSHIITHSPSTVIATTLLIFSLISYPMASGATPAPPGMFADRPPSILSQSSVFANLPRERPLTRAVRELNDLKDLEDYRLDVCAERGVFWEQCFIFGEGATGQAKTKQTLINVGLDYRISPLGALDPGSSKKNMPPTW